MVSFAMASKHCPKGPASTWEKYAVYGVFLLRWTENQRFNETVEKFES